MRNCSIHFAFLLAAGLLISLSAQTPSSQISAGPRKDDPKWSKYLVPGNGISSPVIEDSPSPEYSKEGKNNKIEGSVILIVGINHKGKVEIAEVVKGLGFGLDEKAMKTVAKWKFKPAMQEGKAVSSVAKVEVIFQFPHPISELDMGQFERVGNGVTAPKPIFAPEPDYTPDARKLKTQGLVVVGAVVETDGTIKTAFIMRSLNPGLDQKALEAVSKWKFAPAMKNKQPVRCRINIEVSFNLY